MAQFNLSDYEPVQDRIKKFYEKYPDGRIITNMESRENNTYIFKATLYKSESDIEKNVPLSTGWAQEMVGKGYVNQTSALENCETSAIGRALANIGMNGDKRPSREEMQKVNNNPFDDSKIPTKEAHQSFESVISEIQKITDRAKFESYKNIVRNYARAKVYNQEQLENIRQAFEAKEFELTEPVKQ